MEKNSLFLAKLRLEKSGTGTFIMCKESAYLSKMTNKLRKRKQTLKHSSVSDNVGGNCHTDVYCNDSYIGYNACSIASRQ